MAKPIFIIRTPKISEEHLRELKQLVSKISEDYHVLIVQEEDNSSTTFQMFSDKEIEPIELEKLKEELNLTAK